MIRKVVYPFLDSVGDGIIGFKTGLILTMKVLRCFREVSLTQHVTLQVDECVHLRRIAVNYCPRLRIGHDVFGVHPRRLKYTEDLLGMLTRALSNRYGTLFEQRSFPFRYSTSLLGEPGSPGIVVLCRCACVWTMCKICVKGVQR